MTNGKDAETRKDDLRTGKPYWLTTSGISVPHRADPGRDRFDVIVVGAGISGALTAEALTSLEAGPDPAALAEKLAAAGCGRPLVTSADEVLQRLRSRMNAQ